MATFAEMEAAWNAWTVTNKDLGEAVRDMPPGSCLYHGHDGTWDYDSFPDDGKKLCGNDTPGQALGMEKA